MYSGFVGVQIALAFVSACVRGLHCIRVLGIQCSPPSDRLGSARIFIPLGCALRDNRVDGSGQ